LDTSKKKTIVVSGINMTNSGLRSIFSDCLVFLSRYAEGKNIEIIALVHSKALFDVQNVRFIEFPSAKKSWFIRLYYEFFYFKSLSRKLNPDVWFSLHDISPRVVAKKKFVYCHNPTPFFTPTKSDWKFGFKISVFSLFYKYLYQLNIKSNSAVIVQQHWIKKAFEEMYKIENVKVAHPEPYFRPIAKQIILDATKKHFFYPSFPRMFKNFELIGDAIALLPEAIRSKIQVHFTLDDSYNSYSKYIVDTYSKYKEIHFLGVLEREAVSDYYQACDVLLFPSRLETWGLPLTEFQRYKKPIFAIDLPYALETIGNYDKAYYFSPNQPAALAALISNYVNDDLPNPIMNKAIEAPDFRNWNSLFDFIFKAV